MQKLLLQLFIEGELVELHDDESVTLTQSLQDILDLQKVFTDFTRTFNVPATKTNNKIFKHFYNPDIDVINFRPKEKKEAVLQLNYKDFKKGFVKYESVQMTNNEPENYRITFFGQTITIKDLFKDDKLYDLEDFNFYQLYEGSSIIAKMQSGESLEIDGETITDSIIYPLITHTDRLIYNSGDDTAGTKNLYVGSNSHGLVFDQLKPAIRIYTLIRAIETKYNIKFSTDFFSTTNPTFYNLYLWMQREKGSIIGDDTQPADALIPSTSFHTWATVSSTYDRTNQKKALRLKGERKQGHGSTGFFKTGRSYVNLDNYKGDRFMVLTVETSAGVEYKTKITQAAVGNRSVFHESEQTSAGTDNIITLSDSKKLLKGSTYHLSITSLVSATFEVTMTILEGDTTGANKATATNTFTTNVQKNIYLKDQMPDIKVIDFLAGLYKTFNLTSFLENDIIKVQPLDEFYAASTTSYDVTDFIDKTKSEVSLPIPYDNLQFRYAGNETFLTAFHNQFNNIKWGHLEYALVQENMNKPYKVELPFEHMKFERLRNITGGAFVDVQWGWSVNQDQEPLLTKPLIFYAHKITSGTNIGVMSSAGGTVTSVSDYYIPSNIVDPTITGNTTSQTIHWGVEKNEYTAGSANSSLFETFYRNYITEVFDGSRRIFKFKAFIPEKILLNLQLNDRFIIFNTLYKINKIVTNFETGISDLELLNELDNFEVGTDIIIKDTVKTVDVAYITADTTKVRADAELVRI
tara:strand:+ start:2620 stop:4866 length:2247 start_codon:yes stop_codon:yes gene_type:complete